MLWAENIRSIIYWYRLSGTDEESGYREAISAYRFRLYRFLRPSAVAAALACFDYPACECPSYEGTTAELFVRQLRMVVGTDYSDSDAGASTANSKY